ncbi:MAG TPA: GxxExxY protein, partial [Terriglobales bacterium]|nr:GxxExxY protein [Terriglobales bacterium]
NLVGNAVKFTPDGGRVWIRADLVVEEKVIVELKSVERVSEAHKKQVQTYLRLAGCKLGFLLNFGEALMNVARV